MISYVRHEMICKTLRCLPPLLHNASIIVIRGLVALDLRDSESAVFTSSHNWILHRIFLTDATRHWLKRLVLVKAEEESRRVPLLAALVNHAVDSGDKKVVGLSHEAVGNIDDKRAWDRVSPHPVSGLAQNLETAG